MCFECALSHKAFCYQSQHSSKTHSPPRQTLGESHSSYRWLDEVRHRVSSGDGKGQRTEGAPTGMGAVQEAWWGCGVGFVPVVSLLLLWEGREAEGPLHPSLPARGITWAEPIQPESGGAHIPSPPGYLQEKKPLSFFLIHFTSPIGFSRHHFSHVLAKPCSTLPCAVDTCST